MSADAWPAVQANRSSDPNDDDDGTNVATPLLPMLCVNLLHAFELRK
jgi:hypothetical protein